MIYNSTSKVLTASVFYISLRVLHFEGYYLKKVSCIVLNFDYTHVTSTY